MQQANLFVFDIETVPDVDGGRKLLNLKDNLSDKEVSEAMFKLQREKSGHDFLPHYLQRIVAISCVLRSQSGVKVWSLGERDASEAELIERFYAGLEKFTPILISWNGGGFDLPVIHYRSLIHGVSGKRYWESGDTDQNFRWNNYLNRYHERHTDLMDVLAAFQGRANAPLDQMATLCGFPGKMGMSGSLVWDEFQQGNIDGIRNYCETDVLNTYLMYLRYQLTRTKLTDEGYLHECTLLRDMLEASDKPHLQEFLNHWNQ